MKQNDERFQTENSIALAAQAHKLSIHENSSALKYHYTKPRKTHQGWFQLKTELEGGKVKNEGIVSRALESWSNGPNANLHHQGSGNIKERNDNKSQW